MFRPIEPVEMNFLTSVSAAEVRRVIVERLRAQGGKITSDGAQKIVATFGSSFKMRLLGLTLAGPQVFPREAVIKLEDVDGETRVTIKVRDAAGFGSRLGYTKGLEMMMQQQALAIKAAFPDAH